MKPRPSPTPKPDAADDARRTLRRRLETLRALHASLEMGTHARYFVPAWGASQERHILWRGAPPIITEEHVSACVEALRALVTAVVPRRYVAAVLAREALAWKVPLSIVPQWSDEPCRCELHQGERSAAAAALVVMGLDALPPCISHAELERVPKPMHHGFLDLGNGRGMFVPSSRVFIEPEAFRYDIDLDKMMRTAPATDARAAWSMLRKTPDDVARVVREHENMLHALPGLGFDEGEAGVPITTAPSYEGATHLMMHGSELNRRLARWNALALAHIALALRAIKQEQRAAALIPVPAGREARAPFEMMTRSETLYRTADRLETLDKGGFRMVWEGRPHAEQLAFGFAVRGMMQVAVFRDIMRELKAEGLRDYVILHRMAAEHGRTGRFFWRWKDHRRATLHERRVSTSTVKDEEARKAVIARIWKLASAELHVEVERNGVRAWKVVGEAPLVNVTGGVESHGGRLEGLELKLNPALYEGARADGEKLFTQLPEAVLRLPTLAFCLAVMLGFRFRYKRDEGGVVELGAEELHEYMDAARWRVGNRADAEETLHRTLNDVARAMGDGCRWEPLDGKRYRITPPRVWVDALVFNVPPELPPTRREVPQTGADLVTWRKARNLSQRDAAGVLGVGIATIKRAEAEERTTQPLPRSFHHVDWNAQQPDEGPQRGLPEPSTG